MMQVNGYKGNGSLSLARSCMRSNSVVADFTFICKVTNVVKL